MDFHLPAQSPVAMSSSSAFCHPLVLISELSHCTFVHFQAPSHTDLSVSTASISPPHSLNRPSAEPFLSFKARPHLFWSSHWFPRQFIACPLGFSHVHTCPHIRIYWWLWLSFPRFWRTGAMSHFSLPSGLWEYVGEWMKQELEKATNKCFVFFLFIAGRSHGACLITSD